MDQLDQFKPVRNARDMEKYAELLDVLCVNMMDCGLDSELGGGALYITLQRKLSEDLLSRYNRWLYEHHFS